MNHSEKKDLKFDTIDRNVSRPCLPNHFPLLLVELVRVLTCSFFLYVPFRDFTNLGVRWEQESSIVVVVLCDVACLGVEYRFREDATDLDERCR